MNKLTTAAVAVAALLPGLAAAHPDHASGGDYGLAHLLTDPFHLSLTAVAVALAWLLRSALVRRAD